VPDEVDDAAVVLVDRRRRVVAGPLVAEADLEAAVEERHHLEPLEQRLRAELGDLEDERIGPEADGGAGTALGRLAHHRQLGLELAAPLEVEVVALAVPVDLALEPRRERVHHGHADAVQAAGDLVALALELAARVELAEHRLDRGHALELGVGHLVDRDAAAVVDDLAPTVGEQRDLDVGRVPRHGLVDRVVDDLVHEVVEAAHTGRTDVHAGALADVLEPLERRDRTGVVRVGCLDQDAAFHEELREHETRRSSVSTAQGKPLVRTRNHDLCSVPEG
jgi:hypothetical protein